MKRCVIGVVLAHVALSGMNKITRNPFAPLPLTDNELIATAYIHTTHTNVKFVVQGQKITAVGAEKNPFNFIKAEGLGG
jgi:hypothetical protein